MRRKIGELLQQNTRISRHDVEEILLEQKRDRRRFGEIALAWGLCQPQHIWSAWCNQLDENSQPIDLNQIGIDAQATATLPTTVARAMKVVPLRISGREVVVAVMNPLTEQNIAQLEALLARQVRCVLADAQQLEEALNAYYPIAEAACA